MITGLVDRVILLLDTRFHASNIVKQILKNSGYSSSVINKHIKCRLGQVASRNTSLNNNCDEQIHNDNKLQLTMPYIKNLSDDLDRIFKERGFTVHHTVPKKTRMHY